MRNGRSIPSSASTARSSSSPQRTIRARAPSRRPRTPRRPGSASGPSSGRARSPARGSRPLTRAAARLPAASSGSIDEREMNVTPWPAATAAFTDSWSPSSRRTSRSRARRPASRSSSSTIWRTPAPSCMKISVSSRSWSSPIDLPANRCLGGHGQHDLVAEERLERHAAMARRRADDAELELSAGDGVDHVLRVAHLQRDRHAGVVLLELAEEERQHRRARPGRAADLELARELAFLGARDLLQQLLLEREHPLGAPVEPEPGLGRLHPTTGPVEQPLPEPLLERPDLQAHRGLRHAQLLGGLGEAPAVDHRAER